MWILYFLPISVVFAVWVGRLMNLSWAYKVGVPIDKFELPPQALEIRDHLDVRFFLIPKYDHIALHEGHFWYPDDSKYNFQKHGKYQRFGLQYNRVFLLRVFGTVEKAANGKAILTTVAWSPYTMITCATFIIHCMLKLIEFISLNTLQYYIYEGFLLLFLVIIISFFLKIAYNESKIVSGIIKRKINFAINNI
jgi:hypothetical protein